MVDKLKLPQRAWFGDRDIEIAFPVEWQVEVHGVEADQQTPLTEKEIKDAVGCPIGCPPLREMAQGCKEVAIIFDDISRPTPTAEIIPHILDELHAAGIKDEQIRFIAALGAHGAHTRLDFEKKLGPEVIRRYRVYNHNPYENCTEVGVTSRGTTVSINSEVAKCDLKIAVGCILPHPFMGFGGGSKIILPGIASMDSIHANHMLAGIQLLGQGLSPVDGLGWYEDNQALLDVEEAAELAGLDFKVDALLDSRRRIVGLVAGHPVKAHRIGAGKAAQLYGTPKGEADVVVANANAKASEAAIAVLFTAQSLKEEGGDLVLIVDSPMGQITHYLLGAFGKETGGRLWNPGGFLPQKVKRIIVVTEYPDYNGGEWFGPRNLLHWVSTWDEALSLLQETHGPATKASVFIDGTMQYYK